MRKSANINPNTKKKEWKKEETAALGKDRKRRIENSESTKAFAENQTKEEVLEKKQMSVQKEETILTFKETIEEIEVREGFHAEEMSTDLILNDLSKKENHVNGRMMNLKAQEGHVALLVREKNQTEKDIQILEKTDQGAEETEKVLEEMIETKDALSQEKNTSQHLPK